MTKSPLLIFATLPLAAITQAGAQAGEHAVTKFESVPQGEAGEITDLVDLTHKLLEQRYGAATGETMPRRAVHPKAHGCVKANVTVNADIPEKYRVGVFATPGKTYKAWIRFSNATAVIAPDVNEKKADSRGMAIKLLGVEGDTLMKEPGGKTQDFLLINQAMFAFPNVSQYLAFTRIQLEKKDKGAEIFAAFLNPPTPERLKILKIVTEVIQPTQLADPLDATYFSAAPFLYGKDKVVKFAAKPRNAAFPPKTPDNPGPDYLREAMKKRLNVLDGDTVTFDFQAQIRPDGLQPMDANYPVEVANTEWKSEGDARYQNVATIVILRQDFDKPLQSTECEHLVFTPWHGLVEHQPIGGINRLRREVYIASSKHRADHREPTDYPKWP